MLPTARFNKRESKNTKYYVMLRNISYALIIIHKIVHEVLHYIYHHIYIKNFLLTIL